MIRHSLQWVMTALLVFSSTSLLADPVEAGYQAFERQQWQEAYEYAALPAGEGNPRAQYLLSRLFVAGLGVQADPVTALTFLTFAAQAGHPLAQYQLGSHYYRGDLMAKDLELAHLWWRQAAEQGLIDAQLRLAASYMLGVGVEKQPEMAIEWYRRAADQGSSEAVAILGRPGFSVAGRSQEPEHSYTREHDGMAVAPGPRVPALAAVDPGGVLRWQYRVANRSGLVISDRFAGRIPAVQRELAKRVPEMTAESVGAVIPVVDSPHDQTWLAQQPADNFTLQLFSSDKRQSAERVVRNLKSDLPASLFPFERFGYRWYGVLAGSFEGIEQAQLARDRLVQDNRLERPWIRRFRSVRKSDLERQQAGQ